MKTKQTDLIFKAYNKKLQKLHKENFAKASNNLEYFVTYLRYLRDYFILNEQLKVSKQADLKITSLIMTINEYEEYTNCINKYYNIGDTITCKDPDTPKELVMQKYGEEKSLHWQKFWQLVNINIESWVDDNA